MRLYELDVEKNAPVIRKPEGQPQRVLAVDWERQADQPPEDIVRYAKLMGYNAVSPIILKWAFMNYGDPMPGYETTFIDKKRIWVRATAGPAEEPAEGTPVTLTFLTEGGEEIKTFRRKGSEEEEKQAKEDGDTDPRLKVAAGANRFLWNMRYPDPPKLKNDMSLDFGGGPEGPMAPPGQYRVRLMDNRNAWDCAYPGVEVLPDGTFVLTTYGHWTPGEPPYIVSVRLRLEELDEK